MKDYPTALFDVSSFSVDDSISAFDLISVQEKYIRPVLTASLYEDFIANPNKSGYENLKTYSVACAKAWLFYLSFDKKIIFNNFLENSSESPALHHHTKESAFAVAQASSTALKNHVIASAYELYRPSTSSRICGFLITSSS